MASKYTSRRAGSCENAALMKEPPLQCAMDTAWLAQYRASALMR